MKRDFLLFENTRAVIKAESLLKAAALDYRVMPVPRELSSQCGMCLELMDYTSETAPDCLMAPVRLVSVIQEEAPR